MRVHYAVGGATLYEDFDSVVVTVPSWILEVDVELQGFATAAAANHHPCLQNRPLGNQL